MNGALSRCVCVCVRAHVCMCVCKCVSERVKERMVFNLKRKEEVGGGGSTMKSGFIYCRTLHLLLDTVRLPPTFLSPPRYGGRLHSVPFGALLSRAWRPAPPRRAVLAACQRGWFALRGPAAHAASASRPALSNTLRLLYYHYSQFDLAPAEALAKPA